MIIQILSNLFDEGYLEKNVDLLISPFFSGSNVAFRREIFKDIGLYDVNCATGEDQDMCIRIANSKWELYFQPKAIIGHKCRKTIKAFIKQWYNYGLHHPYILKKHNLKSLVVYLRKKKMKRGILYKRSIYKKRFPLYVVIFVSPFLVMNLFLLLTILSALLGFNIPAIILGLVTLGVGIYYFKPDIKTKCLWRTIEFIFLIYKVNLALLIGGFLGGAKLKMIYINASLDYTMRDSK